MSDELKNKSLAIFVISDTVRAVCTQYDPTVEHFRIAKTFDPTIAVDDLVVIETGVRHEMTVTKVVEVDVEPDFDSSDTCRWIVGRVDHEQHDAILAQEQQALSAIRKARLRKQRRELRAEIVAGAQEDLAKLSIANNVDAVLPDPPPDDGPETDKA